MGTIDLDAKRAARRAVTGGYVSMIVGGQEIRLRPEVPLSVMEYLDNNDLTGFMKALLLPGQEEAFTRADLSIEDMTDVLSAYMSQLGESLASTSSSVITGLQSRLTSTGSTESKTSGKPAGVSDLHGRLTSSPASVGSPWSPQPPAPNLSAGA